MMSMKSGFRAALAGLALLAGPVAAEEAGVTKRWAIAEFGEPLYGPEMPHWPYANPDAPKGGSITLAANGTFDSLNPLIERGLWAAGIGLTSDALMVGSADELVSAYGLVAETAEYPEDRSWIVFNLREEARWHDGVPITADDFVFSFDFIRKEGRLFLRSFYDDIDRCEAPAPKRLKCWVKTTGTMKPLMAAAGLSAVPKHYWTQAGRDLTKTTLEPPLGSGPYRIKAVDPGRSITYERVKDYWAKDLPMMRGLHNMDEIRYEYYRDTTVMFEAFMAGRMDFWAENRAQRWATGYETDAVRQGRIVRRETPDNDPIGMSGIVMNGRRALFQDIRVRQALAHLFDFETIQRQIMYGAYKRVASWFPNSDYGARGEPTAEEIAILEPFKDRLRPEVMTKAFVPPATDGTGRNRAGLREAFRLFKDAGWEVRDGRMVNAADGRPFAFEILLGGPTLQPVMEFFVQDLKRAGITATIRVVDTAQYQVRTDEYDFDMVPLALTFFPPPGPELRSYFSTAAADQRSQGNFAYIKDPVVDQLLDRVITGTDLKTIEATTRALDRVLLWGWHVIPMYYNDSERLAYWNMFGYPETRGRYSYGFPTTWWVDPEKAATVRR